MHLPDSWHIPCVTQFENAIRATSLRRLMRKTQRRYLIALAVFASVPTGLWLYERYQAISEATYEARKADITAYIRDRAIKLIPPQDFAEPSRSNGRNFEAFFESIQSPEIFRIKVFDRQPKIIWSNLSDIIGQDASTNQEAIDALTQEKVTLKFKSLKPEQVSERHFSEFTETYVPIRYPQQGIVGVIEVYQTALTAMKTIEAEFRKAIFQAAAVALGAYMAAATVVLWLLRSHRNRRD